MQLIDALRCSQDTSLAFVGAGGKSTALFTAARELLGKFPIDAEYPSILLSTTTHLGDWQACQADHKFIIASSADLNRLEACLPKGILLLAGGEIDNRLIGLSPAVLEDVYQLSVKLQVPFLLEADGSGSHPLKAPAMHEPVIPDFIQAVCVVAGLSALGRPLSSAWVHRPEHFAQLSGLKSGDQITTAGLVKVLISHAGGLKNIPPNAYRSALLNQADTSELQSCARQISEQLVNQYQSSIIASLSPGEPIHGSETEERSVLPGHIYAVIEPIAGVILAAGEARRFGKPKQLLPWNGKPLIWQAAATALNAGLSPVIVVLGSNASEIAPVLSELPLRIVNNNRWMDGLSSSVKAGLTAIKEQVGGVIYLHADQPLISTTLIHSLTEAHQQNLAPIVAPLIDGQRGNPVLFDRLTFSQLELVQGDVGGKSLFSQYPVHWIPWNDPNTMLDIDTPEDYRKFLEYYPSAEGKQ